MHPRAPRCNGCSHEARFRPQPLSLSLSLIGALNTNGAWLRASPRAARNPSRSFTHRGPANAGGAQKGPDSLQSKHAARGWKKKRERDVPEGRVTSQTAAETVTGVLEAFFTPLFHFFSPPSSLKREVVS